MQNKEIIKEGVQKSKNPPLLKTDHRIFKIALLSERTRLELSNGWLYHTAIAYNLYAIAAKKKVLRVFDFCY
jgi:hypothetical protein